MGNINSYERSILEKEKSLIDIKIQNLENKYNTIFELYKNHIVSTNNNLNNLKNNINTVLEFKDNLNISGEIDNIINENIKFNEINNINKEENIEANEDNKKENNEENKDNSLISSNIKNSIINDEEFKSIINTSINNEIDLINSKIKKLEEIKTFHQNLISELSDKQQMNDIIIQDLVTSFNKINKNKN